MDINITWKEGLSFTAVNEAGFALNLVSGPDAEGMEPGMRPMQLIAVGLGGCGAMDVISILEKKRERVTDFQVHVHAERANDHPRVFTQVIIDYEITGIGINEVAVARAIELSVTKYCSAYAMLSQVVPIEIRYTIFETVENDQPQKVHEAVFLRPEKV
jgi:putative redox protein